MTFLVTFIVPKFMEIFKDFKIEMPAMTQMLINVSKFTTSLNGIVILVGGSVGFMIAFKKFKSSLGQAHLR